MPLILEKTKSPSRRQAWIQKRWKNAMKSVSTIGFKKFEEFLKYDEDEEIDENVPAAMTYSASEPNVKRHDFVDVEFSRISPSPKKVLFSCQVCCEFIEREESKDQSKRVAQCQACGLIAHIDCRPYANKNCQANVNTEIPSLPKFYDDLVSGPATGSQESVNLLVDALCRNSRKKENGKSVESLHQNVDPVYLALKEGNKMASMRKQSLVTEGSRATSQTREFSVATTPTTPPTESIPVSATGPKEKTTITNSKIKSVQASTPSYDLVESSSKNSPLKKTSTNSVKGGTKCESPKVGSSPDLLSEKVGDMCLDSVSSNRKGTMNTTNSVQQKAVRRAPKLDSKLKSFSLDYNETNSKKSSHAAKSSALGPGRHAYRVPPCKYNSFESDETVQSSNSVSPCPSSICGSTLALPSNSYAVTHDYYAKFPDEIDLRVGQRVLVVDTSDQDWWQGHNISGRLGIFPSTCVAHIHCNEKIMQVVHNVCLWVGSKNIRLYRDQIVFAQVDEIVGEGLITVRTERDHRVNCPLQHLMSLE